MNGIRKISAAVRATLSGVGTMARVSPRSRGALMRSTAGASASDYAILVSLVAVLGIGAVFGLGGKVEWMFGHAGRQLDGSENPFPGGGGGGPGGNGGEEPGGMPGINLTVSKGVLNLGQTALFGWSSTGATGVTGTYSLSGSCERLTSLGEGPHSLDWSGLSGSRSLAWHSELAGCSYTATLTASNDLGEVSAQKTVSLVVLDTTPENLAFASKLGVEPGAFVESDAATVTDIEGPTTVSVSEAGAGVATGGSSSFASSQVIQPNGSVKLGATAPSGFAQQKIVGFTAGSKTGSWQIETRERDTVPDYLAFLSISGASVGSTQTSEAAELTGFDGLISVEAENATISVDGGDFSQAAEVEAGQSIVLRATAPDFGGTLHAELRSLTAPGGGPQSVAFGGWDISTIEQDISPDAFVLVAVIGVEPGSQVTSSPVVVSGFDGSLTIGASAGAEISVNGGGFGASATIGAGDGFVVRMTASADWNASVETTVTLGDQTAGWSVSTRERDVTADAFSIASVIDADRYMPRTSEQVIVSGFDGPLTISATNGAEVSVDGGAFSSSDLINPGQHFVVRATASGDWSTAVTTTVSVGSVEANWSVTTRAQDVVPNEFTIASVSGVERSTATSSSPVAIDGFEGSLNVSATNGALVSINSGAFLPAGTVNPGDTLAVQIQSSSAWLSPVSTTVSVGTIEKTWTVTTRAQDTVPVAFAFQAVGGPQNPGATVARKTTTPLSGFDGPLAISSTNPVAVFSKTGAAGTYVAANQLMVNPGDDLWVSLVASSDDDDSPGSVSTNVSVGSTSASFAVATKDSVPAGLAFTPLMQQASGSIVTSNVATLTGFDGPLTLTVSSSAGSPGFRINGDAGGQWQTATPAGVAAQINVGDRLELRLTANATSTITTSVARLSGAAPTAATWTVQAVTKLVYAGATSGTSLVVPAGVTSMTVKVWGGGGGGATNSRNEGAYHGQGGNGGGGGYTTATIAVSPGETLTIKVGGGGAAGISNQPSNGGRGAGGGGYSGIFRGTTPLLIAGGGGGGGTGYAHVWGGDGAPGGGSSGGNAPDINGATWGASGYGIAYGGNGGSQSAGGTAGSPAGYTIGAAGSSLSGGRGGYATSATGGAGGLNGGGIGGYGTLAGGGGGGGGGYYGGGGGSITSGLAHAAGGGGGSSFGGTAASGSGRTAGNSGDADYQGNAGLGGITVENYTNSGTQPTSGNSGLVVIRY